MAEANWVEVTMLYANELAATSRAILGLSSGAIGLMVGLFHGSHTLPERIAVGISLASFLLSILVWLTFSAYSVRFRQDVARATFNSRGKDSYAEVVDSEAKMVKAFVWQQRLFTIGIFTAAATVAIELFKR